MEKRNMENRKLEEAAKGLNVLATEMYEIADDHGFHDNDCQPVEDDLGRVASFVANLHGEVSELWEAARKGKLRAQCDKMNCNLSCAEEELADIMIRAMDTAVALGVDLGNAILVKSGYNVGRPFMHGKKA
jgi:NTP pyrophosphatase (non-canonical NTP hydrolase)